MSNTDFYNQDIRYLKGVGEKRRELFLKLGVSTIGALLRYYPRNYVNFKDVYEISAAPLGEPSAVSATVYSKGLPVRVRGGKTIIKVKAGDETGELTVTYFNNKFAPAALTIGDRYVFFGKLAGNFLSREIINPLVIRPDETASLMPQYPLTAGLSSRIISSGVRNALAVYGDEIVETLPKYLIEQYSLISRKDAINKIHFPLSLDEAAKAKQRLIFEELLTLQIGLRLIKKRKRAVTSIRFSANDSDAFINSLPFALTNAQKRSINDIENDVVKENPMSRLLQGDVGSGKTAVAAAGVYLAKMNGYQSAFMAPTEILANQHAETLRGLLAPFGVTVGLLTSSVKGKPRELLLNAVKSGEVDLLIGTHAIIGDTVEFNRLGFVVADEQHRFGVEQRALLSKKGEQPHLLVMSATPIPRTLALIIYGDLDISVLDELPPGRTPVKTFLVTDELRSRYLGFVRKEVSLGHQAYIVCPLVEESESLENTLSATEYKDELQSKYFADLSVGLIHGKMKPKEKTEVMNDFFNGKIDVLVSTTVIEVGVDAPNATIMIIENAERYGLSTLHQLRGRVGRGAAISYCVLVSSSKSENARSRLSVMTKTSDGFKIAKYDLETRGPGDFFGRRQHGLPELAIADLASDENVLKDAMSAADSILESDPSLNDSENAELKKEVYAMFSESEGFLN